ncbi:MAG TPA: transporter [Terracidiphilus sp.]|nr:transporter [Terracidiphilus sp.]
MLLVSSLGSASRLCAQLPFYTDDSEVTDAGTLHFEFFNEYDGLQSSQFPNLRQNTANAKLNYGLPHNLEVDVDAPFLSVYRSSTTPGSTGIGDTDMGIKWKFHKANPGDRVPALAASFYVEVPTGNVREQLGSGLEDYWLNSIAQELLTDKTRLTANFGFLFAGNTSTGVVGIQTAHGHVYTGGLSLAHDFTPKLSLGGELYGGLADASGLGRDQLQALAGGQYALNERFSLAFAVLGGRYEASPRIGGQVGFALDIPNFLHASARAKSAAKESLPLQ